MDWKTKYIKYKKKYLELKKVIDKQKGAGNPPGRPAPPAPPAPQRSLEDVVGRDIERNIRELLDTLDLDRYRLTSPSLREEIPISSLTINRTKLNSIITNYTTTNRLNVREIIIKIDYNTGITSEQIRELLTRTTPVLERLEFNIDSRITTPLTPGIFPENLRILILPNIAVITSGVLSLGLTHLVLPGDIPILTPGLFPESLTHLTFMRYIHPINPGVLSPLINLRYLNLGNVFNQQLEQGTLPPNLTELLLGGNFDFPIGENILPPSLTHLTFGIRFNTPIQHVVFPPGLTHLTFGNMFNNGDVPLEPGALPNGLINLTLGQTFGNGWSAPLFNLPLTNEVLPESLQTLTISQHYPHDLSGLRPTITVIRK